jgi:hypothetical protein
MQRVASNKKLETSNPEQRAPNNKQRTREHENSRASEQREVSERKSVTEAFGVRKTI